MEQLLLALRDEEWEVREMAVLVLGELTTATAEPLLRIALHDSNGSVREAARGALSQHDEINLQVTKKEKRRLYAPHIDVKEGLLHLWLVFKRQSPLLNRSVWLIPALAMAVACVLTFFLHADAGWSL